MRLLENIFAHYIKKIRESIPEVVVPEMGLTPKLTDEGMINGVWFSKGTLQADTFKRNVVPQSEPVLELLLG